MATRLRTDPERGPVYDEDFAAWAFYQAMLLRSGQLHLLDRAWLAEELDTLGRKEYRTLESSLARILQHMLKWDHQPERRSRSWALSIANHRQEAAAQLEDSPSLSTRQDEAVAGAYSIGRRYAAAETDLPLKAFPEACPYSWDEIMVRPFAWDDEPA